MTELEKKLSEQNEQLTRIISNLTQTIPSMPSYWLSPVRRGPVGNAWDRGS